MVENARSQILLLKLQQVQFSLCHFSFFVAISAKIQGSACDLVKSQVLRLDKVFERELTDAKIVNFVHDEIVYTINNLVSTLFSFYFNAIFRNVQKLFL